LATTLSTDDWQAVADSIDLVRIIVGMPDDAKVLRLVQAGAVGHAQTVEKALAALRTAE
jgi:hypothetical protein